VKRLDLGPASPVRVLALAHHEDQVRMRAVDEFYDALFSVIADAQEMSG